MLASTLAAMVSCESAAKKAEKKKQAEEQRQEEAIKRLGYQSTTLALMAGDAKAIKSETERINQLLGENQPNPPLLRSRIQSITDSAGRITDGTVTMEKFVADQKKEYWKVKNELKECQAAQDGDLLKWTMRGIIVGGIIVVAGMAAAIFSKSVPGIWWLAPAGNMAVLGWLLSGVSFAVRLFTQSVGPYRQYAGATIIGCFCVAAVFLTWKSLRGFNKSKALEQIGTAIHQTDTETPNVPLAQNIAAKVDDTTKLLIGLPSTTPQ